MILDFFHRLLERRHFWRHATFSEIAELYASRMLRMLALNIVASFMSIYLYQKGFPLIFIFLFWAGFFLYKAIFALPAARLAAFVGPKHGILIANLLYIPAMVAFAFVPQYGLPLLIIVGIFQASSSVLYAICHAIDFSKVKSVKHNGKELAFMNIIEKVTTGLSPLIGGLLAFFAGPEAVMVIAAILFALAAAPLFYTGEPIPTDQKLIFRGLPWRLVTRNIASQMSVGFDVFTSGTVWSLFVAITILGVSSNSDLIYALNGLLLSVVLFAALASSYAFGRLIDKRRGLELLKASIVIDSIGHFTRPFISHPVTAAGLNALNEVGTTGYMMAYTKGIFDSADLSGQRVTYIGIMEVLANLGACIGAIIAALLVAANGAVLGMQLFFFAAGAIVLLVVTSRFPLYQK